MNSFIKVLYISHEGDSMKGSTFSLLNMINSLKENVIPIVVIPTEGRASEEFKRRGIEYYIVPFKLSFTGQKGIKRALTFLPRNIRDYFINNNAIDKIVELSRNLEIKIVHSNSAVVDIGGKIADILGIKHVWHIREYIDKDFNFTPLIGWHLFRKKIYSSDAIICISESIYKHYLLENNKRAYIQYNAIISSYSEIVFNQDIGNYLLFCGHVTREKGIEDAIEAFSMISKKYPTLELRIVGSVPSDYLPHLQNLVNKRTLGNSIKFLGFHNNVNDLMSQAQCLLMCSKNEALGRVTVEAMFNGCPVIGFASGGTLEIIKDNQYGFLYNSIDELYKRISYVIENRKNLDYFLKNAREFAFENFSEQNYSKEVMKIYNQLL